MLSRSVIGVASAYTSQRCSGCDVVVAKGLSVRWHNCPDGGANLHRDQNAAKNIERLGQSLRGKARVWPWRTENPWGFSPSGVSRERRFYRILHGCEEPFAKHGMNPEEF
jgi:hypothetical protein